jgi:hypothetical protein
VPAQAATGLPLSEIEAHEAELAFTVADLPGAPRFRGRLAEDGARLAGRMTAEAAPAPATDIYLVRLGEGFAIEAVANATSREGYDSQPAFLPDGSGFLYASQREGQTDIYRYDLATGTSVALTATAEAEYSPTPMPGGTHVSTVRVEADGRQRLWRVARAGGTPELVLADVEPVGYHAWVDEATVALFVLGEPPTLELARPGEAGTRRLAADIGRCLARAPGERRLSYVDKSDPAAWKLVVRKLDGEAPQVLGTTLPESEDYAWTAAGEVLMGQGSKLFLGGRDGHGLAWREVADLAGAGVEGITRLALSSDERALAVVGSTPAPPATTLEVPFELLRQAP